MTIIKQYMPVLGETEKTKEGWKECLMTKEESQNVVNFQNFWQTHNLHLVAVMCCIMHNSLIEWGTYRNLEWHLPNHIGQHHLIVHHNNFIEPATGVHTQEDKSAWNNLKGTVEDRRGMPREVLQSYLNDRMWRQWRGLDNIMANFWHVFASNFLNRPSKSL